MNKKTLLGAFIIFSFVLTTLVTVPTVDAKQGEDSVGKPAFPGNSLYGRMHNPNFMYKWGNQNFGSFENLLKYLQENSHLWKKNKTGKTPCTFCEATTSSSTLVNVITKSATNIDDDSATLGATVELDEGETAEVWFKYGTTSSKLTSETDKVTLDDEDADSYTKEITGLDENTRYYYRVVAEDEEDNLDYGKILYFTTDETGTSEEVAPTVTTRTPAEITDDSATIRGRVEMEDFENGIVFFVYGTDEDSIDNIADDFDTFADIDESGDELNKAQVEDDLDGEASYEHEVEDLDGDTKYYYRVGAQYENEDGEDTLTLGETETLTTE